MAFLAPVFLVPVDFEYRGSLDTVTDHVLGYIHFDALVYYIEYRILDANDTYDATTVTLEWDDGASGADTAIDAIAVAAATGTSAGVVQLDQDDLSSTAVIPAGSRILLTASNPSTGADTAMLIKMWLYPVNAV